MASSSSNFGQISALGQKRLMKEKPKLEKERGELESCGIYFQWQDEIHKVLAMIVGPKDTPYEGGYYFFDILIPNNYPVNPPHVKFMTSDGRVRFNPNLYVEGKVCLSILGTWSGPSWSASCNLRTVLVSIQSLLGDHPIQNEPGYEKSQGKDDQLYNAIIRYENVSVAVKQMLERTPAKFEAFRPQMRKHFLENYTHFRTLLNSYADKESTSVASPIWRFQCKYTPGKLGTELEGLKKVLEAETGEPEGDEGGAGEGEDATADACQPSAKKRRTS